MDWHLNTQNKDYLDLSIKRLNEPALIWVSQFTDIINSKVKSFNKPILKLYPDDWTQSYKWLDRSQTRFHKKSMNFEQSPNAKIAIFHGHPNPHESDKEWVKNNFKFYVISVNIF